MTLHGNDDATLYHLAACADLLGQLGHMEYDAGSALTGPANSTWPDLLCAIMEGLERGWVKEAHLTREGGFTQLRWEATPSGERAMRAFRVRLANTPVVDETGEDPE